MNIILRTLCGCEKIVDASRAIPYYKVPYMRGNNIHIWGVDASWLDPTSIQWKCRTFERIGITGLYGYPVFLETE